MRLRHHKNSLLVVLIVGLTGCSSFFRSEPKAANNENTTNNNSIENITNQISKNPQQVDLYINRANAYVGAGQLDNAQNDYKKALEIAPNNPEIQYKYANFLCGYKHDSYSAEIIYRKLLSSNNSLSESSQVYTDFANCISNNSNNTDYAIDLYLKALSLDNPPATAYLGINSIYYKQGEYARAYYYISLYKSQENIEVLEAKLNDLNKLLSSNEKITNRNELRSRYDILSTDYYKLTGNKFVPIASISEQPRLVTAETINNLNSTGSLVESKELIRKISVINNSDPATVSNLPPKAVEIKDSNSTLRIMVDKKTKHRYVIVEQNETLYGIQRMSNVSVKVLEKLNNLKNGKIKVGDKIFID